MDFEKIAEATHQAWFVAMAKQGWTFGPRLNPDLKTHPWLKPYAALLDPVKEIVRAQARGALVALEGQGLLAAGVVIPQPPKTPVRPVAQAPVPALPLKPLAGTVPAPAAPEAPAAAPIAVPVSAPVAPSAPAGPLFAAAPAAPAPAPKAAPAPAGTGELLEVVERKVDASGRMRIGSGLVKKAGLLPAGATQVAIVQDGGTIQVVPAAEGPSDAFFAAVNPDGFMLPKAMLGTVGGTMFRITLRAGSLAVAPVSE